LRVRAIWVRIFNRSNRDARPRIEARSVRRILAPGARGRGAQQGRLTLLSHFGGRASARRDFNPAYKIPLAAFLLLTEGSPLYTGLDNRYEQACRSCSRYLGPAFTEDSGPRASPWLGHFYPPQANLRRRSASQRWFAL